MPNRNAASENVTRAFEALLAGNRGPHPTDSELRVQPRYGLSAKRMASTIEFEFRFLAGQYYCCGELGCHLRLRREEDWTRLRGLLDLDHRVPIGSLAVQVHVIVESDARFFDFARPVVGHRGYYEFKGATPYEYEEQLLEREDET